MWLSRSEGDLWAGDSFGADTTLMLGQEERVSSIASNRFSDLAPGDHWPVERGVEIHFGRGFEIRLLIGIFLFGTDLAVVITPARAPPTIWNFVNLPL
jgi:hypothetical protein